MARAKTEKRTQKKTPSKLEVGDSGTRLFDGIISEEYNSKLSGTKGIAVYEEMRKSDGTVRAGLQAVTLPIRSAEWYVRPGTEDEQGEEVAEFVKRCLWELQELSYDDFLRHALLALPFGVMLFEKVFDIQDVDGVERVVWKKLAPRLPKSIMKWNIAGDKPGITQNTQKTAPVEIPMEKLIVFVNEKEGDNWWGTSILRAAYKHWYMKTQLEKIDAIAHERHGIGIPEIVLPEGATSADYAKAEAIAKNVRANSQAHVIRPEDFSFGMVDMKSSGTKDASASLSYHSGQILMGMLAQFLALGSSQGDGKGGSRALSEDHSKLFLQAEESIARWFCSTMKPHIKELVDLNFDGIEAYPEIDFEGITEEDVQKLAGTYGTLKNSGVMTAQDADEASFREKLGLPELDEKGIREEEPEDEETFSDHRHGLKKNFSEGFKPSRKLTFAEKKVSFEQLQDKLDELESILNREARDLLHAARHDFIKKLTTAANKGDTKGIKEATLKAQAEYARILKVSLKSSFEFGKTNAAREIGVGAPANPSAILQQIDILSDAIAETQIAEITADAKTGYVETLARKESVAAAIASADALAKEAIDRLVRDTGSIVTAGYINQGRDTVFDRNGADIYALQRSELLDAVTCAFCEAIDGRVVEKDDSFARNGIFHSNCRGIWVAIMKDEEELPKIGGIPKSLRNRYGDAVNDLTQPKRK